MNSMSDLFHAKVPIDFVRDVFDVIRETPQHTYQVLTKRAHRLARVADQLDWPANLWMGVSVESFDAVDRIDHLRATPAAVRFLSCEPLLTRAAAAGPRRRSTGSSSAASQDRAPGRWIPSGPSTSATSAHDAGVAFFFKQWGGRTPKANGRELEGRTWDEMPALALS